MEKGVYFTKVYPFFVYVSEYFWKITCEPYRRCDSAR